MSDDHAVKTDSMLTGLEQPQGGLTRSEREMTGPRTALSVAAVCMTALTPVLYLAIEQNRGLAWIVGILVAMAVPPVWAAWKQALVRHTSYELTSERLRVTHGILSLEVDDIELYRIKDIHVRQPLLQRICALGSIVIWSSDVTLPRCRIHAQPIGVVRELREKIRLLAEDLRDRKVVRNDT